MNLAAVDFRAGGGTGRLAGSPRPLTCLVEHLFLPMGDRDLSLAKVTSPLLPNRLKARCSVAKSNHWGFS